MVLLKSEGNASKDIGSIDSISLLFSARVLSVSTRCLPLSLWSKIREKSNANLIEIDNVHVDFLGRQ